MMINDKEDEVVKECFKSFPSRYQIGLKQQREVAVSSLNMVTYCITNVVK